MSYQNFKNILFLDIETVPQHPSYEKVDERMKLLWDKKAIKISQKEEDTPENIYNRAGIYAEFGKIICISAGYFHENTFRIAAYSGHDEAQILKDFSKLLNVFQKRSGAQLCAHNGKEFDFPYICRRMLINGLPIPSIIDSSGKKPWETTFIDTMELWRFGDYKNYTSLELLTAVFGIPTPKDEIDGSMVWDYYWNKNDLETIAKYCCKDVVAIAQLYLRMKGFPLIADENVVMIDVNEN